MPTPWSAPTAQYRANVLSLLRDLSWRGARPFLLVPSNPNLAGDAALWWRDAAQYADIVREVYVKAPEIYAQGALLGSRTIRVKLRAAVDLLVTAGVQPERVGLMLGLQSGGIYGRAGLQPREAWFELVKWQALAARQVAADHGVGTVWSWGWGTFGPASVDADKPAAACVYLWTRDPALCDAPTYAGAFNTSVTDGQILLAPGIHCAFGALLLRAAAVDDASRVVGDRAGATTAVFARLVQRTRLRVSGAAIRLAEGGLIARRFGGRRTRYLRALTARGLTPPQARDVLADELRRRKLGPELAAWTVAEQERLLAQAVCLRDELPAAGDARLADRVRFLRLA